MTLAPMQLMSSGHGAWRQSCTEHETPQRKCSGYPKHTDWYSYLPGRSGYSIPMMNLFRQGIRG